MDRAGSRRRVTIAFVGALVVAGMAAFAAPGGEPWMLPGPISARVLRVVDGDTIVVRARIWLGQDVETSVRLAGVDAPEIRGVCPEERLLALKARDLMTAMVEGLEVTLRDVRYGKYAGRVLARVEAPGGADLSQVLLSAGLARAYHGETRSNWCAGAGGFGGTRLPK